MSSIVFLIACLSASFVAIFAILLLHKGKKNISNMILSIFFLTQLWIYINCMLIYLTWGNYNLLAYVCYMAYPVCWLWGPLFFHYIKSQTVKNLDFKIKDALHLTPFLLATIYIIIRYYSKDFNTKVFIITHYSLEDELTLIAKIYEVQLFIYNIFALKLFLEYRKRIENFYSSYDKQSFTWLKYILFGYIACCFVPATFNFAGQYIGLSYNAQQIIDLLVFLMLFGFLFYQAIIRPYDFINPVEREKNSANITSGQIELFAEKLSSFMINKKPYLNQFLTIKELSKVSGINERILSQVIKKHWNQNFYAFINSYRIEEAKQLLNGNKFEKITMLGIAFESGFNSKSVFYDTFRKFTGMTPSDYRKEKEQNIVLVG